MKKHEYVLTTVKFQAIRCSLVFKLESAFFIRTTDLNALQTTAAKHNKTTSGFQLGLSCISQKSKAISLATLSVINKAHL